MMTLLTLLITVIILGHGVIIIIGSRYKKWSIRDRRGAGACRGRVHGLAYNAFCGIQ